ncbi:MAG: sugar transferase [Candidatus Omnitrophota bacterium]
MVQNRLIQLKIKRLFDVVFSITGIIIALPLWILIVFAIILEDGRPIFFTDERVGKDGKIYRHLKFRSMIKHAEKETGPVWSRPEDARVTKLGKILRASAMDESPQLLNILKGDMSVVGPRPERIFFVEKFIKTVPRYADRHAMRPGLTGLAQVNGKHDTDVEEKLKYDLEYIKKFNFLLDLKLICISFLISLRGGWERFEKKVNVSRQ